MCHEEPETSCYKSFIFLLVILFFQSALLNKYDFGFIKCQTILRFDSNLHARYDVSVPSDVMPLNVYMYVVCAIIDLLVRLRANPSIFFPQHFHSVFLTLVKMKVSVFHQAAPILAIADVGFIS